MRFIYTKTFAIFAACLVLLTILLAFQSKGWLEPIKLAVLRSPRPVVAVAKAIGQPVKNFFSTIYQLKEISKENGRLSAKVMALQLDLVGADQLARENESLRKELGFSKAKKKDLVSCTVLSHNPFGLQSGLALNCGSEQGVEEGMPIISQGFLVGKIVYAGKSSSQALLLTASNFLTDGRLSKTNQSAIVKGSFGSGIVLDQIPQAAVLEKGYLLVTAGINEKIPQNILIGEVSEVLSAESDLFKRASIYSPIDFNNLEFVFVEK